MAKFCSRCGTPLEDNDVFCANCGARQSAPQPAQSPAYTRPAPAPQPAPAYTQPAPQQTYAPQQQAYAPQPYAQPAAPKKKSSAGKVIASVVCLVLAAALLLTCFWQPGFLVKSSEGPKDGGPSILNPTGKDGKNANAVTVSAENLVAETESGVTVELTPFLFDYGEELALSVTTGQTEDHSEDGYKIDVYDIKLGDMHELGDYITIRIPYDTTYCKAGQDPAKCVGAKYKNDATGEWEDVLFEVDAEKQELVIYTDHMSYYGALYVEDEGRRNALVTDVLNSPLSMDKTMTLDFARRIAEGDESVKKDLAEYVDEASGMFFDYADRLDNAINIATLGDVPEWLDTSIPDTNLTLFSALGYIATTTNLLKVAKEEMRGGASKGEVLNLIRDVGSKVTTYWADAFTTVGSGALSVGMGGVLIIDKMLTAFAEEAQSTKMEDIAFVYHHYNEGFSATWAHKVMTPKDWRAKVIQVLENNPDNPEIAISALEAGFRKYASEFFSLTADQMYEVASDVPNVTVKRIPNFTEAEKEQLIDEYVAHLKDATMPAVLSSVENYMIRKTEEVQLAAINEIKEYYNTKITITMQEDLPKDAKSPLAGYKFRFAPLSETAVKKNWTGTWPESGKVTDTSTLIGFMTSGYPHTVEFFKPGDDPDSAKPEFTVPFKISVPSITINVSAAPTFDELLGYYEDGTITITEFYMSDALRASLSKPSEDDELGCDFSQIIPSIEEQKGVPQEFPFIIVKVGENAGILQSADSDDGDEEGFPLTYDPVSGILSVHIEEDGASLDGALRAKYNADKTGVEISGEMWTDLAFGSECKLTLRIQGSKPLTAE